MVSEFLATWWPAAVAALAAIMGFRTGQDRNRWRIDMVEKDLGQIKKELHEMKTAQVADAVSLGVIQSSLTAMQATLEEIKTDLRRKVDK